MELKLNTDIPYICNHTTVHFLQKHSVFMPEGKVFDYEQTYLLEGSSKQCALFTVTFMRHYIPLVSMKYSWLLLGLLRDEVGQRFIDLFHAQSTPVTITLLAGLGYEV